MFYFILCYPFTSNLCNKNKSILRGLILGNSQNLMLDAHNEDSVKEAGGAPLFSTWYFMDVMFTVSTKRPLGDKINLIRRQFYMGVLVYNIVCSKKREEKESSLQEASLLKQLLMHTELPSVIVAKSGYSGHTTALDF
eukprot:GHVR01180533.1.p1 GENE.GHVR01180533.1~~GHVR01180533.1.p1  ORF type:complete len:138 (+),score=7.20 GHVR01180533.1:553-966(+)